MKRSLAAVLMLVFVTRSAGAQDAAQPDTGAALDTIQVETQTPAAPAPLPGADAPRQLEEIVVTAQKTTQSLQQVPLSVTAIDRAQIRNTGSNDLADLSLYVPNVRIDADDLGSPQIFIRGFGTNSFNPSFESSVGFVQDELYFGRPGYFTEAMFDIDRIEVLRGPQGTLFGKNTIAGVFNISSVPPGDELEANLEYKTGAYGEQRVEGGIGGPFGDWGGARLSGLYRSEEGQLHNHFLDRSEEALEQRAARLKLRVFPALGISSELTLVDAATEIPFWPFQLMKLDQDTRDYLEGFDPAIEDDPLDFDTSFDTPGFLEKGSTTAGLKTDWQIPGLGGLNDFHAVLVLGSSRFYIDQLNELDVSPADIARLDNHERHKQASAELRFTGGADSLFGLGDRLEFVAGGFWYDSTYSLLARVVGGEDLGSYFLTCDFAQLASMDTGTICPANTFGVPGLPGLPALGTVTSALIGVDDYQFDYLQDVSSGALFGQMTWYLTEHWAITPGLRYNRERKRVDSAGTSHCPGRETGRPCVMEQLLMANDYDHRNLQRKETDLSPKLVLQYFTDGGTNFYVSHARGYKSGGFNSISFTGRDLEYEPEKARTSELGVKGKYFDRTLRIALTGYQTRFDNLQVLAFAGLFPFVSNAASATSRGLEAELTWLTPAQWLTLNGSLARLQARYKDYQGSPAPISNGIGATQDLSGRTIAFAPSTTFTFTPTASLPIGSLMFRLSGDAIFQGAQYTDTDLDPNTYQAGYWKYAARLIVGSQGGGWALILGGINLSDDRTLNQVTDALFFPGTYYVQQSGGRQLFATLSLQL